MIEEIIRKLPDINDISTLTSSQVLTGAKQIEAQRPQTNTLDSLKEKILMPFRKAKVTHTQHKNRHQSQKQSILPKQTHRYKYCG